MARATNSSHSPWIAVAAAEPHQRNKLCALEWRESLDLLDHLFAAKVVVLVLDGGTSSSMGLEPWSGMSVSSLAHERHLTMRWRR